GVGAGAVASQRVAAIPAVPAANAVTELEQLGTVAHPGLVQMVLDLGVAAARPLVARLTEVGSEEVNGEAAALLHTRKPFGAAVGLAAGEVDLQDAAEQENAEQQTDHQFDDGQA